MTFAESVILFYRELEYRGSLPEGVSIMNPYRENPLIIPVITRFYSKFFSDEKHRHLILGINPGRFGAGVTGIPFTDTTRLLDKCGINIPGLHTFETSSVFIYEMIDAYGGPVKFYSDFYISSVSPLGFTSLGKNGKHLNYNYYDSKKLTEAVFEFMITTIEQQLEFGIKRDTCFSLGSGKNFKFITEINKRYKYFGKIIPLEHPRFIMQYRSKQKDKYIARYIEEFNKLL
jgi:hypothetical protein